jgi:hypothetical protein
MDWVDAYMTFVPSILWTILILILVSMKDEEEDD